MPAVAVNMEAGVTPPGTAISTIAAPGSISGLAETAIQLSPAGSANPQAATIPLDAMGVRTREQNVLIWIQSEN
jgi:hypothetical protein